MKAEIAGAGFAGLVAATALAQHGWSVRVHDTAPAPHSVGSGLYVFPFAQWPLERIGALELLRQHAVAPRRRLIFINGEHRSTTQLDAILTTTRAQLHAALVATASRAGVAFAWSSEAVGAKPEGALILADGTHAPADLIVAADGVRSAVAQGAGFALRRVRHTDGITRVLLDRTGMRGSEWDDVLDLYDYRYRPLRLLYTPCGTDAFYLCLMTPQQDTEAAAVPVDAGLWTRSFPRLAGALSRVGGAGRHDRYGTTRLERWSHGRLAVVGDAAHAMPSSLGQGAGVSMMNALALADNVAADPAGGLARWELVMRPVVERWQSQAEQVASERNLSTARHPGHDLAAEAMTPLETVI